ncbi:hypothetical protein SK128_006705 [Halocaridina rubra]|uniref:Uncharacterized protein n=1 Tax=Halocaridina rubra TaxID=373956 RepID=A0AAN8WP02_HALRR
MKLAPSREPARSPFVPSPKHGRKGGDEVQKKNEEVEKRIGKGTKNPNSSDDDAIKMAQAKEDALNQEIEKLRSELLLQQEMQQRIINDKLKEMKTEDTAEKDSSICVVM